MLMGYNRGVQDGFGIVVHGGGKDGGMDGFLEGLMRLPMWARHFILLENDEFTWGLDDVLTLQKFVPIVLDIHHHWIHSRGEYITPKDKRWSQVLGSWKGARPKIHYTTSKILEDQEYKKLPKYPKNTQSALRAHSSMLPHNVFNDWALSFSSDADIQVECKNKNLAAQQLFERAQYIYKNSPIGWLLGS
jgi:UV DNA damage repair endonuclease